MMRFVDNFKNVPWVHNLASLCVFIIVVFARFQLWNKDRFQHPDRKTDFQLLPFLYTQESQSSFIVRLRWEFKLVHSLWVIFIKVRKTICLNQMFLEYLFIYLYILKEGHNFFYGYILETESSASFNVWMLFSQEEFGLQTGLEGLNKTHIMSHWNIINRQTVM